VDDSLDRQFILFSKRAFLLEIRRMHYE